MYCNVYGHGQVASTVSPFIVVFHPFHLAYAAKASDRIRSLGCAGEVCNSRHSFSPVRACPRQRSSGLTPPIPALNLPAPPKCALGFECTLILLHFISFLPLLLFFAIQRRHRYPNKAAQFQSRRCRPHLQFTKSHRHLFQTFRFQSCRHRQLAISRHRRPLQESQAQYRRYRPFSPPSLSRPKGPRRALAPTTSAAPVLRRLISVSSPPPAPKVHEVSLPSPVCKVLSPSPAQSQPSSVSPPSPIRKVSPPPSAQSRSNSVLPPPSPTVYEVQPPPASNRPSTVSGVSPPPAQSRPSPVSPPLPIKELTFFDT